MSIKDHWKIRATSYFLSPEVTQLRKMSFCSENRKPDRHWGMGSPASGGNAVSLALTHQGVNGYTECWDTGWLCGQNMEPSSNHESFHRKASCAGETTALSRGSQSGEADVGSRLSGTVLESRSVEESKAEGAGNKICTRTPGFLCSFAALGFLVPIQPHFA